MGRSILVDDKELGGAKITRSGLISTQSCPASRRLWNLRSGRASLNADRRLTVYAGAIAHSMTTGKGRSREKLDGTRTTAAAGIVWRT